MFTKIFSKYIEALFTRNSSKMITCVTGIERNFGSDYADMLPWLPTGSIGSSYHSRRVFEVGRGVTPPSIDDTTLEYYIADILGTYTVTTSIGSDGEAYCQFNITFTNNGNESHTITEYGWLLDLSQSAGASSNRAYGFLCYRGLFDNPITIEPGTSFNFVFVERISI